MGSQKSEDIDCPYCGKCPVCGLQNNHAHHRHPPWTTYPCHPFYAGKGNYEKESDVRMQEGLKK